MGVSPVGVNAYTDRPDNMPVALQVARLNACVFGGNLSGNLPSSTITFDNGAALAPLRLYDLVAKGRRAVRFARNGGCELVRTTGAN